MSKKIAKSAVGVTIVMLLGYALSFGKEALMANYFGVSNIVDAYSIAIQVPVLLFSFISVAIKSVVIPIYSNILYQTDSQSANAYINRLLTCIAIIALGIILLAEIFADPLIYLFAPGFDNQSHLWAAGMLRVVMPVTFFSVIIQVFTAILNVHKHFVLPSFAVYFLNIGLIVTTVLLHAQFGIWAACVGQLVGEIMSFLFVTTAARKIYHYKFEWRPKDENLKRSVKMTVPILWTISIGEVNAIVNRIVGSFLVAGSISALSYAGKVDAIIMGLFVSALTTIVYPLYAESAAKSDYEQLSHRINMMLSVISMIILPLMCGVFIFKRELVTLVFARGNFDENAVMVTQGVLGFYTIGLLFMALRTTVTNIFHSLKDTHTPAVNASVGAVLNIILNVVLAYFLGINGLALARSLVAMFITINLIFLLKKKNPQINTNLFLKNLKGIVPSALIMFVVVYGINKIITIEAHTLTVLIGAAVGAFVYALLLYCMRVPIFVELITRIKRR